MIQVQMLRSERGSKDGFTIEVFEKDKICNLNDDLAKAFIKMGVAKKIKTSVVDKIIEEEIEKKKEKIEKEIVKPSEDNSVKEIPEKNRKKLKSFKVNGYDK